MTQVLVVPGFTSEKESCFCGHVARTALRAMLYEVCLFPKPGLVDARNNGAHNDMSIFTFVDSSIALEPVFSQCVAFGLSNCRNDEAEIFSGLRSIGKQGETIMYQATNGVNTHKGLVFTLGTACAALGILHGRRQTLTTKNVQYCMKDLCRDLVGRELEPLSQDAASTAGQRQFLAHGLKGIRGEAQAGFPAVFDHGLSYLTKRLAVVERQAAFLDALLMIMTVAEDSNVVKRGGLHSLEYMHRQAEKALELGGATDVRGMEFIKNMDQNFVERGISPGGCADLLALCIFIHYFAAEYINDESDGCIPLSSV